MRKNFERKTIPIKILIFLTSSLLSLFILEFLFRIHLFGWDSFSLEKMNSILPLEVSGLIKPSYYSEVVYELKPNLKTFFKSAPFETNSQGLRDKEYEIKKPANTFRVAVIGDSLTMPAGVKIEESFHSLLEDRLNKEQNNLTCEFLNFGVGGYSLRQYLGVIKHKAQKYELDLILVGFYPNNDHIIPPNEIFQQPYKVKKKSPLFFNSYLIETLKNSTKYVLQSLTEHDRDSGKDFYSKEQKEYMSEIFSSLGKFSKDNNIPIAVFFLSHRPDSKFSKGKNIIENFVISNNLFFVDLSKAFIGKNLKEYRIYPTDDHPNAKANLIFAAELYDFLNEKKFLQ